MLDKIYDLVTPWAVADGAQKFKNRALGQIANYVYPLYCRTSPIKPKKSLGNKKVIVSLTSFPARIEKVYLCVNSLLRQTYPAERVILWLAHTQFPNKRNLPPKLLALEYKGLEIKFCEDLRSYKKIFFTAQEFVGDIIITADDDTLYPEYWIEELIRTHEENPRCVCCHRAHKMVFKGENVAPYNEWIGLSPNEKGPAMDLVPIGVGGVLYPAHFFEGIIFDSDVIRKLCPTTDDLWLKTLGVIKGYKVAKVRENSKEWFTLKNTQKNSLMNKNVAENMNDQSLLKLFQFYNISYDMFRKE